LWRDNAASRLVGEAENVYTRNRELLNAALADRGVASHGRSGLNVWIPVPDETVATSTRSATRSPMLCTPSGAPACELSTVGS
jgi:DNA-binding transcriptional MocR family regulator